MFGKVVARGNTTVPRNLSADTELQTSATISASSSIRPELADHIWDRFHTSTHIKDLSLLDCRLNDRREWFDNMDDLETYENGYHSAHKLMPVLWSDSTGQSAGGNHRSNNKSSVHGQSSSMSRYGSEPAHCGLRCCSKAICRRHGVMVNGEKVGVIVFKP